jgi:flagellar basal-body rod modification protein FlgD
MSGTSSTSTLLSAADLAAAGLAGTGTAPSASTSTSTSANTSTGTNAAAGTGVGGGGTANPLASLTNNFQDFLSMLTTQLQNQDPTSPMDSSQFTTELVQFTGVEAQIQGNGSLTQLIQLAQGGAALQASQMIGKTVQVTSNQLSLQNGTATIDFTAPSAGPAAIAIYATNGQKLFDTVVNATAGSNSYTWNGQTANGTTMPDGTYNVAVEGATARGAPAALPFTVQGTVTGTQQGNGTVSLDLGALTVGLSSLAAVKN